MGYKNPVIIELYSELNLANGSLGPNHFFQLVPKIQALGLTEVEIGAVEAVAIAPQVRTLQHSSVPRIRCWDEKRTRLVQLSPDIVVVNQLGPYPGWTALKSFLSAILGRTEEVVGAGQVSSASIATIDRLEIKDTARFQFGRYIQCDGKFIPTWYATSTEPCDITLGRGLLDSDGFNRQLKLSCKRLPDGAWEIQVHSIFHDRVKPNQSVGALLEELHGESTATFEQWITDDTRDMMGRS